MEDKESVEVEGGATGGAEAGQPELRAALQGRGLTEPMRTCDGHCREEAGPGGDRERAGEWQGLDLKAVRLTGRPLQRRRGRRGRRGQGDGADREPREHSRGSQQKLLAEERPVGQQQEGARRESDEQRTLRGLLLARLPGGSH